MAIHLTKMKDKLLGASIVGVLVLTHAAYSLSADAAGQYDWSAELVALDPESATATLKARMDARVDKSVLGELSDGDPITITWTGLTWGAGIAAVGRDGSSASTGQLHLPAEFVGTELDEAYLLFRVPVPQDAMAGIGSLEAGTWVTATTPRDAAEPEQAVSAIRPYNDVS